MKAWVLCFEVNSLRSSAFFHCNALYSHGFGHLNVTTVTNVIDGDIDM